MIKLNKQQKEAVISEVTEILSTQGTDLPVRVKHEYEKLKEKLEVYKQKKIELQLLEEEVSNKEEHLNVLAKKLEALVEKFQDKNGVTVHWEYQDFQGGEDFECSIDNSIKRDKISRAIDILSISKNGPVTAQELIDHLTQKFSV